MEIKPGMVKNFVYEHVQLQDVGADLPVVFRIDEGYRRMGCYKTNVDGEKVVVLSVSNVKVGEAVFPYKAENGEEVVPLLGFVVSSKKEAYTISEFFKSIAENMEESDGTSEGE